MKQWDKAKKDFDKKCEAAKAKAKVNQQQLKQIQAGENGIAEIKKLQMANRNALTSLGETDTVYNDLRTKWNRSPRPKN